MHAIGVTRSRVYRLDLATLVWTPIAERTKPTLTDSDPVVSGDRGWGYEATALIT